MKVLFDTSALYALISPVDIFHTRAKQVYEEIIRKTKNLYITSYVLVEIIALIHRRLSYKVCIDFISSIEDIFTIIFVDEKYHKEAWKKFIEKGKSLSFVDCSTLIISQDINAYIFTFDEKLKTETPYIIQ